MIDTTETDLRWLLSGHSLNSATDLLHRGQVSQAAYDRFVITWHWAAFHFSASSHQERCYRKCGLAMVTNRIERCKRRIEAFLADGSEVNPYCYSLQQDLIAIKPDKVAA